MSPICFVWTHHYRQQRRQCTRMPARPPELLDRVGAVARQALFARDQTHVHVLDDTRHALPWHRPSCPMCCSLLPALFTYRAVVQLMTAACQNEARTALVMRITMHIEHPYEKRQADPACPIAFLWCLWCFPSNSLVLPHQEAQKLHHHFNLNVVMKWCLWCSRPVLHHK